jgi:fructosamine-3-kinase
MAAMHAKFLGTQEFPELKKNDDPLFCPSWTLFVQEKWPEFQKRWSHFLTDAHIQIGNKIVESFDQIQKRLSNPKESLTLIHGDIKSPNIFYRKTDFEPFFIDWQ